MKSILKIVCFAAFCFLAIPAFANQVYSGNYTTYVPHPTIPNRLCEVITSWHVEVDDHGNIVSSSSSSTNACGQGMVINHTLNVSAENTHINSLTVASFDIQNGGQDGPVYNAQLSTAEALNQLAQNMNQTISTNP